MALKVKNPKKNLADILIEKERLNESYDSSSAVSLKTLESMPESAEAEIIVEKAEMKSNTEDAPADRPIESMSQHADIPLKKPIEKPAETQPVYPAPAEVSKEAVRRPIYDMDDYNPPRKKRGRPYQGYAENTHVQSIYVRNDLYEYIMVNYVGHGRKHTSFNKFVNTAINNYLRMLDEER